MPGVPRLKTLELANLPRAPTPLRSVNFRHTTPGSGVALVTKFKSRPNSELLDPSYPGAHLLLSRRHAPTPHWVSKHLSLYAFPKAFLSKPDVPYHLPYVPRPYPARPRRPEQRNADMSMQIVAFNSRVVLRPTVRTKIKRRMREAIRLIVTRGAAVEESPGATPKVVFRPEDAGAEKWIVPDWTYIALPTTEMFRMPFAEQLGLMRKALGYIRRRIPDVEKILRSGERQASNSLEMQDKKGNSIRPLPRTSADKVVSRDERHRMAGSPRDYDRSAKVMRTSRAVSR